MYNNKITPNRGNQKGQKVMRKLILLFTLFAFACTPLIALADVSATYGGFVMVQSRTVESGDVFTAEVTLSASDANVTSMIIPVVISNPYITCTGVDFSGSLAAGTMEKSATITGGAVTIKYMASYENDISTISQTSGLIATLQLKVDNAAPDYFVAIDAAEVDISFEANGETFSRWNRLEFADESGGSALLPNFVAGFINIKKSTGIDDELNNNLPQVFELSQNYPNPFNPSTKISFALPTKTNVRLEIFNLLGQKVANLAQGEMEAGYHEVNWNAGSSPSGVYFYRLITDEQSLTRKMMLLK